MDRNNRPPHFSPGKSGPVSIGYVDGEEPYPSLSDFHDYEPNLEFDDSELQHTKPVAEATDFIQTEANGMIGMGEEIDPDFIEIAEDYEEELTIAEDNYPDSFPSSYPAVGDVTESDRYEDIQKYGIVDVKGDDAHGRKIIVVYACKLPPTNEIDHSRFLGYLKQTLDLYVEQDYSLIYFHYGLTSRNKPRLNWLRQAYTAFDRKYKKNLKALYVVHPTYFFKVICKLFTPLISAKFGQKLNNIQRLQDLNQHIPILKLDIPNEIVEYDRKLSGQPPMPTMSPDAIFPNNSTYEPPELPTQQFGVTLQFIKMSYNQLIPPVVRQCVEYLEQPDAIETEGIFRRSANSNKVKALKEMANLGEELNFSDPHEAAVLLKKFLRELREPLLTFELYDEILQFQSWSKDSQLRQVSILVMEKLPQDNYELLKYIVGFLSKVMERADLNKMNAQNLAVVFGPNLVWSEFVSMSLNAIGPINMFTQFLLLHHNEIFII